MISPKQDILVIMQTLWTHHTRNKQKGVLSPVIGMTDKWGFCSELAQRTCPPNGMLFQSW